MTPRLLVPAVALLLVAACRRAEPVAGADPGPALPVRIATVAAERLPVLVEAPATVRPADRATLAAKLTGNVASFPLGLGGTVAAGDVLLTLNAPETEARVRQAQARLAEAERNADRARTLVEKGVNAPDSLRDAEDNLRYAQAAAAEAEALLAYATVRAPFAGVITEKHVLPGDLATPGLPLLALESTQRLRAEGTIPEQAAAGLRLGDAVAVRLDDAGPAVSGRIEEISAAADVVSRSVLVKVALPADRARSGQFARLQVPSGHTDALLVPAGAVTRFGQMERIFVVEQGRASLRLVKTGRRVGERVEILSGVNAGERVVLDPPAALRDGQPVAP
ncbi:MAG: efflux RND transporter periplasmic adaptor subunit [Opitutaceae bacterium]|nr:efflux RND transporter periplasmic adaptor subunit [Opitutaceae bacterium]